MTGMIRNPVLPGFNPDPCILRVGKGPQELGFLSGGFTGNFIGIAAYDIGQFAGSHADFSHFRYEGKDLQQDD